MRHSQIFDQLRLARRARGLSQASLAALSGAGRVTIARLESGAEQDFRIGTLARLCEALELDLVAIPRNARDNAGTRIARERERARGLDLRRRHAALAARLLDAPPADAAGLVRRARANVDRWEREKLCSSHYITRWRQRLAGPARRAALALLQEDEWTDALLRNSPWSFTLGPAAA